MAAEWLGPDPDPGPLLTVTKRPAAEPARRREMARPARAPAARMTVATRFLAVVYTEGAAMECTP